jgi:hypothetical protein
MSQLNLRDKGESLSTIIKQKVALVGGDFNAGTN